MFYDIAGKIFRKLNFTIGIAYAQGNCGMVQAKLGENDLAVKNLNEAIATLKILNDFYPICVYLTYLSDISHEKGDNAAALEYLQQSLDLAREYGLKEQIGDANLKLSKLYQDFGNYPKSLDCYRQFAFRF